MSTSEPIAQQTHQPSSPNDSKNDPSESELSTSTYQSQSTTSLPAIASTSNASTTRITFAPLPSIEPRKRRSTSQIRLGVSARSSMMRRRRPALENFHSEGREEGWSGALPKSPSSEVWQDEQTEYPRANKQRDGSTDAEDPFLAMSRMVKSAWRRVAHVQTQSTQSNGSGHDRAEQEQDVNQPSLEKERKTEPDCERKSLYTHEENLTAKQVSSDKGVNAPDKAPIRSSSLKFKNPMLVRSASEPWGNVTSIASER